MEKKNKIILVILIIIGICVRIYNFPNAISEMNSDEIMTTVHATSIAATGKTLEGMSYPVYLCGWGGQSVVLLYLMAIGIKILGTTLFAVRLPMLIVSIISIFVFYDFVKKISKSETIALIGLGLLVISPWHIIQSIWSLDCNMFPHFLLIAMDFLYTGISTKRKWVIYLSMVFYAITLYCYGAIYFVPLFLIVIAIYLLRTKNIQLKDLIICIIIFTILALPIVMTFAINVLQIKQSIKIFDITIPYYEYLSRTQDMIFFAPNKIIQLGKNIVSTLGVVIGQYDGAEWNSPKLFGTIYQISIIFIIIAIYKIIKNYKKEDVSSTILITWLAISLITGTIVNNANINRLNSIWYLLLLLTAIGIYNLYEKIKHKKIYKYTILSIYTILGISFTIYFYTYFNQAIDKSGCFSRGFYKSLSYVKNTDKTDIYYSNLNNDGCMKLYIQFNNDSNKKYHVIEKEEELKNKIDNIKENEIVIVDMKNRNDYKGYKIDDYMVIEK